MLTRLSKRAAVVASFVVVLTGCVGCGGPVPAVEEMEGEGLYVRAPEGTSSFHYDLFPAGERGPTIDYFLRPNEIFTVAPGHYDVVMFLAPGLILASDVVVTAGHVTVVELGAIHMQRLPGARAGWNLFYANEQSAVAAAIPQDETYAVPAGRYDVKQFNGNIEYAHGLEVVPGRISTTVLGAVQYGPEKFDVYAGGELVSPANNGGEPVSVPAGDYTLKFYFSEVVIATVHVDAGQLVVVP